MKYKLTLVGAGPGDKDLIAWKGIKALQEANVILYDALVNKELLDFSKENTGKVYVGKRAGKKSFSQSEINQLTVSYCALYGNVVRLKGGDPFIFGRGYEEVEFAKNKNIQTEVIPGISSATGLTSMNNISLTRRGVAHGFWVLTASLIGDQFNSDIILAAQSNSTVVILMGVRKLSKIVDAYLSYGKFSTPIIIIQNGSKPDQKIVRGDIKTILKLAKENKIEAPAILVIGDALNKNPESNIVHDVLKQLN